MLMNGFDGSRNVLLNSVTERSLETLTAHLEPIALPTGYRCASRDQRLANVYFPTSGIISRSAGRDCRSCADAGIYGRDGFSGIPLVFGLDRSPHDDIVQVAGRGFRAPVEVVDEVLQRDTSFRGLLLYFIHCLSLQASFSNLSSKLGDVKRRLARLLIMCLDRIDGHELELTHSFLATTLGVRRASVTSAIHHLEGDRLITARRGRMIVRDRPSLLAIAGACYGPAEREYGRLLGAGAAAGIGSADLAAESRT